jgi:HPt (histidine-containing phosphotransfer) domain-containing protein
MDSQDYLDHGVIDRLSVLGSGLPNKLITLFLEQAPRRLDSAVAGGRAGDWKSVEDAAHSLKSSAGNLGAFRLRDLADRVEALAAGSRNGKGGSEEILVLLTELEAIHARTRDFLLALKEKSAP